MRRAPSSTRRAAGLTARALTSVAADIAGRRRASDVESWLGDIVAESPGYGPLGPRDQVRYARGLVHAGIRMRLSDAAAALGGVLDRWLVSDAKVCGTSALAGAGAAGRLWLDGGFLGVVVHGQGLVALAAAPWAVAVVLRRVRGVEPRRRRRDVGVGGGRLAESGVRNTHGLPPGGREPHHFTVDPHRPVRRVASPVVAVGAATAAGLAVCAVLGWVVLGMGAPVALRPEPVPVTTPPSPEPPATTTAAAPAATTPPAPARLAGVATADVTAPDNADAAGNRVSYPAANVVDGDPATTWRAVGDARGRRLRVAFPAPRVVTAVGLVNGYAKRDPATGVDRYAEERRVLAVTWIFDDGTTYPQTLGDGVRGMQRLGVDPVRTTGVWLRIDATTPPGDADRDYTAVSEIELVGYDPVPPG
jgi:hypothetical protein